MKQKTIAGAVRLSGKGLHFGKESTLTVMPAEPNTGYLFVRTDLDGCPHIRAIADNVNETSRGTTVTENGVNVSTIEHLMAATYAMGIDNAEFRVDGPEVPILDGSSRYYVEAFSKVGTKGQDAELKVLNLDEPVSFTNGDTEITLLPANDYSAKVVVDYGKAMPTQTAELSRLADFPSEIANCRTFVFLSEIEPLLKMNLIKGGDLDNAIVVVDKVLPQSEYDRIAALCGKESIKVQESGILNTLKLQFDNEPARHKLLDIIGDLALCGFRFNARIEAVRPGHFANTQLSKKLRQYFLQKR
ncbi:MAG: UDP-3-O-acyl-N-acetylglucosamine deacetylase [Bacteroidales bacterium]|nr:UDP-3-O-acyl-N-acetylglucosamine deacetylase [Bacteroidales bacterium]